MKFEFLLLLLILPFLAYATGLMAKNYGQRFWSWFFLSLPFPIISSGILLFLYDRRRAAKKSKPVENDEIFDHLFIENTAE